MPLKNKSMYAILGILNISPSTGYDIKKYSDKVLAGFWNENFGHIYPTLKKLLESGMIEILSPESNEKKILYGITGEGRKELEAWLAEEIVPQPVRSEFMLKLLFSSGQDMENVIKMLEEYKEHHVKELEKLTGMLRDLEKGIDAISKERRFFVRSVLRRGIISTEAVVQWCNETIDDLKEGFSS